LDFGSTTLNGKIVKCLFTLRRVRERYIYRQNTSKIASTWSNFKVLPNWTLQRRVTRCHVLDLFTIWLRKSPLNLWNWSDIVS
jgi:hypothetical protein